MRSLLRRTPRVERTPCAECKTKTRPTGRDASDANGRGIARATAPSSPISGPDSLRSHREQVRTPTPSIVLIREIPYGRLQMIALPFAHSRAPDSAAKENKFVLEPQGPSQDPCAIT